MTDSMRISHLSSLMIEISVPSNLELVRYTQYCVLITAILSKQTVESWLLM